MSKKTNARIQDLRDTLNSLSVDISGCEVALEAKGLKKKKLRKITEDMETLAKARKKAYKELNTLAPGLYTIEGWMIEVSAPEVFDKTEPTKGPASVTVSEAAKAGERHLSHLARIETILEERKALEVVIDSGKKKARAHAQAMFDALTQELLDLRKATEKRAQEVARETVGRNLKITPAETDAEIKARVLAKRAAREAGQPDPAPDISDSGRTEPEVEAWLDKDGETPTELTKPKKKKAPLPPLDEQVAALQAERKKKGKKILADTVVEAETPVVEKIEALQDQIGEALSDVASKVLNETDGTTVATEKTLEDAEPTLRRDRWDRPLILTPEGKEEGYRRVTTYIDVLEDKTTLVDWKQRVVVVGVAAIEQAAAGVPELVGIEDVTADSVLARVEKSNLMFAQEAQKTKKALKKGKLTPEAADAWMQEVEKSQKATLNELVSEAFKAGDGFLKAEAGTRLHYLAECIDKGVPLPDDVTDLELRDLEALQDAYRQLEWRTLDVERFVVHDGYRAGGTLDRRGSYVSPSLGRRVTAIGDIKTGRMDYGSAKMARQCAMYGASKGYDPAKPEERVNLRCNQKVALIFHLPAGSGICTVYELDLDLGHKGLKLCQAVYDYRAETSTLKKVTAAKDGKGIAVGVGGALTEKVEAE